MWRSTTLLVVAVLGATMGQEYIGHALFVRTSDDVVEAARSRVQRAAPASAADVMAQNILEWIQGIYRQGARKIRQQSDNAYLPPYSTQRPPEKPRPFQPAGINQQESAYSPSQNEVTNYPYQRPSSLYTPSNVPYSLSPNVDTSHGLSTPSTLYGSPTSLRPSSTYIPQDNYGSSPTFGSRPQSSTFPPFGGTTGPSNYPSAGTRPGTFPSSTPSTSQSSTYLPPQYSGFPSSGPSTPRPPSTALPPKVSQPVGGYPSQPGGFSTTYLPPKTTGFPSSTPSSRPFSSVSPSAGYPSPAGFTTSYGYTSQRPGFSSTGTVSGSTYDSQGGYVSQPSPSPGFPTPVPTGTVDGSAGYTYSTPGATPSPPFPTPIGTPGIVPGGGTTGPGTTGTTGAGKILLLFFFFSLPCTLSFIISFIFPNYAGVTQNDEADDDLKHPPHIHNISVECGKTMMTINIEFNRAFDGVIYSKGFFMNPDCRYVEQNSGKTEYSFTVSLDSCGTQFINDFEGEAGQAYLENVLVLQNEPGIQEVWDTVRRVRCLWEGNINKALSVNLSVDMLNQEIVTFSGDTAVAKLDIQIGKGPFAPTADGLVKIGETMTLVVTVEGDPAFDLQVRDCVARDESSTNTLQLTDERGCILKPKLFGAFQKTNDTGNTGASIIAYAFFQAFKFPDVMDLFIECNVELCKTDCQACPESNQQIEPGRRRRSVSYAPSNASMVPLLTDPVRVGRGFKVIMLDDLSAVSNQVLENIEESSFVNEVSKEENICMSNNGFYAAFSLMLGTLILMTVSAAALHIKLQRIYRSKSIDT
uniref:uncharacterized protein LOC127069519 isoform X1 n=1 Tax=Vespula vulgaris TaxID=7454 RepID=UPI00223AA7BA|nr:uncharacterized protein LOC127069519 isoform X1 [Vespula vulgaris]XP_050862578.1 uncharacterized protein LOC127069519 isoform X1 [Vespula vulgaris]